jgi:hypothetical protein
MVKLQYHVELGTHGKKKDEDGNGGGGQRSLRELPSLNGGALQAQGYN